MSILSAKSNTFILLGITLFFSIFLPIFSHDLALTALLLVIVYWGILSLAAPRLGLWLLLLLRPCLDLWTDLGILSIGQKELNLASFLSLMLLIISGLMLWKKHTELLKMPLKYHWLAFLLIAGLSILWSTSSLISIAEFLRLSSYFAIFFYGYVYVRTENDVHNLFKVVIISGFIPSALALYQLISGSGLTLPFEGIFNRIYGTFAHPNLFAYYLLLPICCSLYFTIKEKNQETSRLLYGLVTIFYSAILVLTYTRGAWLAFFIIIVILGIMRYRALLFLFFVAALFAYGLVTPIQERINDIINNPYSSVDWRQDLWKDARGYATEKPLLGQGAGTAKDFIAEKRGPQFGSSDPHNDYLKILLENGLVGLVAYLSLITSLLFYLVRAIRNNKENSLYIIMFGLSTSLFLLSFGDNILRNTALGWCYWALIGATLHLSQKK